MLSGQWPPEGELMENLARTEHLRWCAFHAVMGYRRMDRETWDRQAEAWRKGQAVSLGKDRKLRLHCCMIPWEELEELSARENAVTGRQVDYQEMDRENVRAVKEVLKHEL